MPARFAIRHRAALAVGLLFAALAGAQGVYRHVDEKGKVTFSDVPPDKTAARHKVGTTNASSNDASKQLEIGWRQLEQQEEQDRLAAAKFAAEQRRAKATVPTYNPGVVPRRGAYDPSKPPGQTEGDTSRRY